MDSQKNGEEKTKLELEIGNMLHDFRDQNRNIVQIPKGNCGVAGMSAVCLVVELTDGHKIKDYRFAKGKPIS